MSYIQEKVFNDFTDREKYLAKLAFNELVESYPKFNRINTVHNTKIVKINAYVVDLGYVLESVYLKVLINGIECTIYMKHKDYAKQFTLFHTENELKPSLDYNLLTSDDNHIVCTVIFNEIKPRFNFKNWLKEKFTKFKDKCKEIIYYIFTKT